MQCSWQNISEFEKGDKHVKRWKFCPNDATHINYNENIGWCDKHFALMKKEQPDFIELSGKYYPPIIELKMITFNKPSTEQN